jgi:hypothetical protein
LTYDVHNLTGYPNVSRTESSVLDYLFKLDRPHATTRIAVLEKRIRYAERYQNNINNSNNNTDACKQLKQELADLLKEEDEKEILHRLPLYSASITNYRFVCSILAIFLYSKNLKRSHTKNKSR